MLLITCPYCQHTFEEEDFLYAGEAFIERPQQPDEITDAEWADYLFMRTNPKGPYLEQWTHAAGCRKFFVVKRNTANNQIEGSWTMAEAQARKNTRKDEAQGLS